MKKKISFLASALALFAVISFNLPERAEARHGFFKLAMTSCYSQANPELQVGFSNDCTDGGTGCIDNACPAGSYEGEATIEPGGGEQQ